MTVFHLWIVVCTVLLSSTCEPSPARLLLLLLTWHHSCGSTLVHQTHLATPITTPMDRVTGPHDLGGLLSPASAAGGEVFERVGTSDKKWKYWERQCHGVVW
jgi:hypothetical protein